MRYKKSLTTSIIAITLAMMFTATIPVYAQNPPGQLSGSGSGTIFCHGVDPVTGPHAADVTFEATYDPATGAVQSGSIRITSAEAGDTFVRVTEGQVGRDPFTNEGFFRLTGSVEEACGQPNDPEASGEVIQDFGGLCGDNSVFAIGFVTERSLIGGEFTGSADCGASEPEPEPCPDGQPRDPVTGECPQPPPPPPTGDDDDGGEDDDDGGEDDDDGGEDDDDGGEDDDDGGEDD